MGVSKRTLPCRRIFLTFADQIFQKVGGIKNHFGPFFAHFLPTLLSLQVAKKKFSKENQRFYRPLGFKKDGLAPYTHLG